MSCRIPATNQGGIVSTAIRIPRKVVPQTMATVKIAIIILGSLGNFTVQKYAFLLLLRVGGRIVLIKFLSLKL